MNLNVVKLKPYQLQFLHLHLQGKKKNEEIQINPTKPKSTFPVEEISKIRRQISEVT